MKFESRLWEVGNFCDFWLCNLPNGQLKMATKAGWSKITTGPFHPNWSFHFSEFYCSVLTNNLYLSLFAWVNLYVRLPPPTNQKNFTQYLCETWIALVNLKVISTSRCRTPYLQHLEGTSNNPDIFKGINRFWLGFTMVVYEKMYLGE